MRPGNRGELRPLISVHVHLSRNPLRRLASRGTDVLPTFHLMKNKGRHDRGQDPGGNTTCPPHCEHLEPHVPSCYGWQQIKNAQTESARSSKPDRTSLGGESQTTSA